MNRPTVSQLMNSSVRAFWAVVEGQADQRQPGEQDILRVYRVAPPGATPAHRYYEVHQGDRRLGAIVQVTPNHKLMAMVNGRAVGSYPATPGGMTEAKAQIARSYRPQPVQEHAPAVVAEMDLFWGQAVAPPPMAPDAARLVRARAALRRAEDADLQARATPTASLHEGAARACKVAAALQPDLTRRAQILARATQHLEAAKLLRREAAQLQESRARSAPESLYGFWATATAPRRRRVQESGPSEQDLKELTDHPPKLEDHPVEEEMQQLWIWSNQVQRYIPQGQALGKAEAKTALQQAKKDHAETLKRLKAAIGQ